MVQKPQGNHVPFLHNNLVFTYYYYPRDNYESTYFSLTNIAPNSRAFLITKHNINPIYMVEEKVASLEFVPNTPFLDALRVAGSYKTRLLLVSVNDNRIYSITNSDFVDALQKVDVENGVISGTWKFVKRLKWGIMLDHSN